MPANIHICDDNRDAADSLALLLRLQGFDVAVTYDGQQALAAALGCPPAVMLIDLALPKLDGYDLAREVRKHAALSATVLAAVTGWADPSHRALAREAGYHHFLVKPIEFDELQKVLPAL
jgi:DNA-binding response OmpR family regulator